MVHVVWEGVTICVSVEMVIVELCEKQCGNMKLLMLIAEFRERGVNVDKQVGHVVAKVEKFSSVSLLNGIGNVRYDEKVGEAGIEYGDVSGEGLGSGIASF